MTENRIDRMRKVYTSVVHDVMRARGLTSFTLPSRIRPLQPDITLCGPVFTVEGEVAHDATAHDTLLAWTGLLSKAPPGHVWCAQPNSRKVAQMGELSAETLHAKGVLGCVLDGALRDSPFILRIGFPCWRTHHTPVDIVAAWLPTRVDETIRMDDVEISPGDWLHGDRDGMVRIPSAIVDEIAKDAAKAMETENQVRTAIRGGTDPQEAYLAHGKF